MGGRVKREEGKGDQCVKCPLDLANAAWIATRALISGIGQSMGKRERGKYEGRNWIVKGQKGEKKHSWNYSLFPSSLANRTRHSNLSLSLFPLSFFSSFFTPLCPSNCKNQHTQKNGRKERNGDMRILVLDRVGQRVDRSTERRGDNGKGERGNTNCRCATSSKLAKVHFNSNQFPFDSCMTRVVENPIRKRQELYYFQSFFSRRDSKDRNREKLNGE